MIEKLRSQKGVAAVEFAIVLPVLSLILFGIIEFSILLYNKAVITNASREGARAGIVVDATPDIPAIAAEYCEDRLVTFASSTASPNVVVTGTCTNAGDEIKVRVDYTYHFLTSFFLPSLDIHGETVMRCEM